MKSNTLISTILRLSLLAALCLCELPAAAQSKTDIEARNRKGRLARENRKNLKEAARYQSDFKETHLNTDTYQYEPGKTGRKSPDGRKLKVSKNQNPKSERVRKPKKSFFNKTNDL